jgi:prepilin-type N-terminal cleavage/methylation domain-containing protein
MVSVVSILNAGWIVEGFGCGISVGGTRVAAGVAQARTIALATIVTEVAFIVRGDGMNPAGKFGAAASDASTICYLTSRLRGRTMPARRAFTIIELTITLCILSVLSAIAMPWAGKLLDRVRVRGAVVQIESTFGSARHIAIARAAAATVDIDTVGRVIKVSVGSDTVRTAMIGVDHDVRLGATRSRMSYSPTGMGYGAANLSVFVQRSGAADTVFVSRLGRLRH